MAGMQMRPATDMEFMLQGLIKLPLKK